jgi:hypothetical protein
MPGVEGRCPKPSSDPRLQWGARVAARTRTLDGFDRFRRVAGPAGGKVGEDPGHGGGHVVGHHRGRVRRTAEHSETGERCSNRGGAKAGPLDQPAETTESRAEASEDILDGLPHVVGRRIRVRRDDDEATQSSRVLLALVEKDALEDRVVRNFRVTLVHQDEHVSPKDDRQRRMLGQIDVVEGAHGRLLSSKGLRPMRQLRVHQSPPVPEPGSEVGFGHSYGPNGRSLEVRIDGRKRRTFPPNRFLYTTRTGVAQHATCCAGDALRRVSTMSESPRNLAGNEVARRLPHVGTDRAYVPPGRWDSGTSTQAWSRPRGTSLDLPRR